MEEEINLMEEEKNTIEQEKKTYNKGGRILRLEPSYIRELMSSPLSVKYFQHVYCFEFCEMVQRVQSHPNLARIFITNLQKYQVAIARVTFTISTNIIATETWIPNVGEKWFSDSGFGCQAV